MVKALRRKRQNPLKKQAKTKAENLDVAALATSRFEERNPVIQRLYSQFAHPEGWVGRFVGMILVLKNRERNLLAIYFILRLRSAA